MHQIEVIKIIGKAGKVQFTTVAVCGGQVHHQILTVKIRVYFHGAVNNFFNVRQVFHGNVK